MMEEMRATSKVDSIGRVIIPASILNELGVSFGEPLEVYVDKETKTVGFRKCVNNAKVNKLVTLFNNLTENEKELFYEKIDY